MIYLIVFLLRPFSAKGFHSLTPSVVRRRAGPFRTALQQAFWEEATKTADLCDEEIIRRLHEHYHELQEELFADLAEEDKVAATQVSKEIFKTAADLNQVERYEQYLKFKESQEHLQHAQEDVREAEEWVKQTQREAKLLDEKSHTVESVDEIFDRSKRERDSKISQAARNCEQFAKEILLDAQGEQLQAELEYEYEKELLKDLQNNEHLLQRSLAKLDAEEYLLNHWYEMELPKNQHVLQSEKSSIRNGKLHGKRNGNDPPEGNVAP